VELEELGATGWEQLYASDLMRVVLHAHERGTPGFSTLWVGVGSTMPKIVPVVRRTGTGVMRSGVLDSLGRLEEATQDEVGKLESAQEGRENGGRGRRPHRGGARRAGEDDQAAQCGLEAELVMC
jgi:hypothetical protein